MQFPHIVSPILLLLPKLKATLQHTHSLWSHLSMCISTAWHQKYVCVSWTPERQRGLAALQFSSLLRVSSPNQCKALSWSAAIPVPKSIVGCLHSFQQYRESAVWVQNVTDCGHSSHDIFILVLLWSVAESTKPSPIPLFTTCTPLSSQMYRTC